MINVLCVIGTRPEAIKMAPVIKALRSHVTEIQTKVCVSAQHRELLDQALRVFEINPDYDLDVMSPEQSPSEITAKVITGVQTILDAEIFDWMLVQGDTTTVMAAALAAFYSGVKVGHVEAGLRSFNRHHPFPEEINRRLLSVIADRHFAPTENAHQNLLNEGIAADRILVTGNTVIDALHMVLEMPYDLTQGPLRSLPLDEKKNVLVTVHRRESFGSPLEGICEAVRDLAETHRETFHFVWPVHPNPNVKPVVHRILGGLENVSLIDPLNYVDFCQLIKRSYLILTDSGGIQEEAPSLGVPVLVLREVTERTEAVDAGAAKLVGTDPEKIKEAANLLFTNAALRASMVNATNPFGDGKAAERIVGSLSQSN
ncbi:MAG: non-hydrolyzing UDP-N-acetylglucosamine 2-epimerase [Anaerolineales bacterium]